MPPEEKVQMVLIETLRNVDLNGTMRTVCASGRLTIFIKTDTHTSCIYDKGDKLESWQPPCQSCYIREQYKNVRHLSYAAWKGWLVTHKEIVSPVLSG